MTALPLASTSPSSRRRAGSRMPGWGTLLRWALFGAVLAVCWPVQLGGHIGLTVVSGHSMEPTHHTGDLVITRTRAQYRPGQVVVYRVPDGEPGEGLNVVHRITAGTGQDGFTTQGDNNPGPDIWTPHHGDVTGEVALAVPHAGTVLLQARNPLLYAFLGALYIGVIMWRDDDADDTTAAALPAPTGPGLASAPVPPPAVRADVTGHPGTGSVTGPPGRAPSPS